MLEKPENEEEFLQEKPLIISSNLNLIEEKKIDRDENQELLKKEKQDYDEKTHLEKIFKRLGNELNNSKEKKLAKVYKKYIINEKIANKIIREKSGKALLCFMFQILLPLMEIINLIGVFSIISVMNCCFTLFVNSIKSYIGFGGEFNLYFYKEFYNQSMNEPIDFNVMFFMSFLGNTLLKSSGFIFSSFIFLLINFASFFMIVSFDFKNNIEGEEDKEIEIYNFFNLIYILLFYIILFVGVGGSSMLSQQVLVDSHDILQKYYEKIKLEENKKTKEAINNKEENKEIENKEEDADSDDEILDEGDDNIDKKEKEKQDRNKNETKDKNDNEIIEIKEEKKDENDKMENANITEEEKKILKEIEEIGEKKETKEEQKKKKKDKKKKKVEGKFDYFFMICITTIIGYFGKYYFFSILGFQLFNSKENKNYKNFYYYVMVIYATCIIVSILIYGLFLFIFKKNDEEKKEEENEENKEGKKKKKEKEKIDTFQVYQILGFTIYKENINTENKPKHNNFCLLCESIRNCCDDIVCYANCNCMGNSEKEECKCCCCCCPEYNEEDYNKNDFLFCYFYQGRRKQKWFHSFLVNKTQEELIPYMTQYFFLQLFVIGFEEAYNTKESSDVWEENLNSFKVFVFLFILLHNYYF